jgi:hypothetical protein
MSTLRVRRREAPTGVSRDLGGVCLHKRSSAGTLSGLLEIEISQCRATSWRSLRRDREPKPTVLTRVPALFSLPAD